MLLRVLYGLVQANDPAFYWVDIRETGGAPDIEGPVELGWIEEDHLYVARQPEDFRPQDALGNLALWTIVRSDEPESTLTRLSDFLRLPDLIQEFISRLAPHEGPRVMAIANTDRVRGFYPTDPHGVRAVLDGFLEGGVLPFMAARAPPGAGRTAFDFVFEVRVGEPKDAEETVLYCEKAPPVSSFRAGDTIPLHQVPDLVEVLARERHR